MNALSAMNIPYWTRVFLGGWALVVTFFLPVPVPAATDEVSGMDWTAKRVEVEQRLAIAMANLESAQAKLRQEPEAVKSQSHSTAKLVRFREGFVNVYRAELDAIRKLENQHLALVTARKALAEWQPPAGSPWPRHASKEPRRKSSIDSKRKRAWPGTSHRALDRRRRWNWPGWKPS